jgi:hypothetical protein
MEERYPSGVGAPSTTNIGWLLPVNERMPRIFIFAFSKTPLFVVVMDRPETFPFNACCTFTDLPWVSTLLVKELAA